MNKGTLAGLIEEGGRLLSDLIRIKAAASRPYMPVAPPVSAPAVSAPIAAPTPVDTDISYRFECVAKHLGGASVLLREAYERANDEGVGPGTAEKIQEAMNEHAGAEPDLEHMLSHPQGKEIANKLLSGIRSFRKASWEAKLPTGGGTKQDIEDARLWNSLMFKAAMDAAGKYPGTACVASGM